MIIFVSCFGLLQRQSHFSVQQPLQTRDDIPVASHDTPLGKKPHQSIDIIMELGQSNQLIPQHEFRVLYSFNLTIVSQFKLLQEVICLCVNMVGIIQ